MIRHTICLLCLLSSVLSASASEPLPALDCIVRPSEEVDIGSAVPGLIETVAVGRNDRVMRGEVVARLDSAVEKATVELARARAESDTEIRLRRATARFGQRTEQRNRALRKSAAVSAHELDQSATETRIAWLQVRQARENRHIAELEHRRALAALARRVIHSPIDGVVTRRYRSAGEYVDQEPILRVARLDPLHIEVVVPVRFLGRVSVGQRGMVTIAGAAHAAVVDSVDRVADAASGTYGVRLTLPNPDLGIPAGLRCRIEFQADPPPRPLALAPRTSDNPS